MSTQPFEGIDERNYAPAIERLEDKPGFSWNTRESAMFSQPQAKQPPPHDPRLDGIPMDEPIFVLRGIDILAPALVRLWCEVNMLNPRVNPRALAAARQIALLMEQCQGRQWPENLDVTKESELKGSV